MWAVPLIHIKVVMPAAMAISSTPSYTCKRVMIMHTAQVSVNFRPENTRSVEYRASRAVRISVQKNAKCESKIARMT